MAKTVTKKKNVWTDMQPKKDIVRPLSQVPGTRKEAAPFRRDASRKAREPGLRISKNGKKYWETRENRSDDIRNPDPKKRML